MKKINEEDLIGQLKEKGLKITPQRLAIIDALVENCDAHPGATLIYKEARKKAKRVSLIHSLRNAQRFFRKRTDQATGV